MANPIWLQTAFTLLCRVGVAWALPREGAGETREDEALMMAYRAGDAGAFDLLYARHRAAVFRFMRRQVGNEGVAEELFQDVWMRVLGANYEPRAKFTTWLYTIAHNRLMDHFRSAGRADLVSIEDEADNVIELPGPENDAPETMLTRKQIAERILAALDTLPPEQREAFILQFEGELSVEDIAQATGVTRETAKSRLRYAMGKLRQQLMDSA